MAWCLRAERMLKRWLALARYLYLDDGRDPHAWLTDVLTRLLTTKGRDIDTLLAHQWQPVA